MKISGRQLAMLLFLAILATAILFVPAITAQKAFQSAWLATLILPNLVGVITLSMVWKLGSYFPEKTLAQYSEVLLGKILGKLVAGAFALFFGVLNVLVVREFAEFLVEGFMPETPIYVFCGLLLLVAGYAALKGPEVIGRMAQFVLPLFVASLLVVVVLSIPDIKLDRLQPILAGGIMPIVQGSWTPASWYGEIVVCAMLLPVVNKPQEVWIKGIITLQLVTIVFSIVTITALAVFGPYLTGDMLFPVLELAKYIYVARFIQRLEILVMTFWVSGIVIKAALVSYVLALSSAQVINLKNYKYMLFILGPIQLVAALFVANNTLDLIEKLDKYWTPFALCFELLLPFLLLTVAWLRPGVRRRSQ